MQQVDNLAGAIITKVDVYITVELCNIAYIYNTWKKDSIGALEFYIIQKGGI
jgi:hypothetical protein